MSLVLKSQAQTALKDQVSALFAFPIASFECITALQNKTVPIQGKLW